MRVIKAQNAHEAMREGLSLLREFGIRRKSRAGEVLVFPGPVTTEYKRPTELVVFWEKRDANPFFHLMEGLWMLGGRRDVEFIKEFNGKIAGVASDDGEVFHGAYGHRWRHHFGQDQLPKIVAALKENPEDRRQVLQMWDPREDLGGSGKDYPCNTSCYFTRNELGELDLTVCCRSNDLVWGCYGSDSVTFGMLLEYVAAAIGCRAGRYWQVSNNFHGYTGVADKLWGVIDQPYRDTMVYCESATENQHRPRVAELKLVSSEILAWDLDLHAFLSGEVAKAKDPFFQLVAEPMRQAWRAHKRKDDGEATAYLAQMPWNNDWRIAADEWLRRRAK